MKPLAAIALWAAAGAAAAQACPPQVRVSLPNFPIPPLVLGSDQIATPPGQLVLWTLAALKASGCAAGVKVLRLPPNRQLAEVDSGDIDLLPGFSYSAKPAANMVFPMREGQVNTALRVYSDLTSLYVRKDEQRVSWDGQTLGGVRLRVGSSTGGATERATTKQRGWEIEAAPTPLADVRKLLAGRIDVILESDSIVDPLIANLAVRKLAPPLVESYRYVAVRAGFQRDYPDFTARFWLEVCRQSRKDYPALPACK